MVIPGYSVIFSITPPAETVATRFVGLLESHGVHRNQIPRFIGHGLTLTDVQDDTALLAKLDEPLLDAVCTQFAVHREWLDGAGPQIHPVHDFYKQNVELSGSPKRSFGESIDRRERG